MEYSRKSHRDFLERKETLKKIYFFTDKIIESALSEYRRKEVSKDDILDALVPAITAKMGSRYGFEFVPRETEKDINGLKIQMVYYIPNS